MEELFRTIETDFRRNSEKRDSIDLVLVLVLLNTVLRSACLVIGRAIDCPVAMKH